MMHRLGRDTVRRDHRARKYFYGHVVAVVVAAGIIEDPDFVVRHFVDAYSTACSDIMGMRKEWLTC
jgi:hypothetical protein